MSSSGQDEVPPSQSGSCATTCAKAKRKPVKLRSVAWNHFKKTNDPVLGAINTCTHCKLVYRASTGNGTSNMRGHILKCPKNPDNISKQSLSQTKLSLQPTSEGGSSLSSWKFDQDLISLNLTKMLVIDQLSLSFVEGEGFKKFVASACPWFRIPSRRTITRNCVALYNAEFESLKSFFKKSCQRVSLTTDTWTSIQRINYMCLTAHFIDDDWKLHKRIINFCPISSHKGEFISLAIEQCLRHWEIEDKVFTITVDNASSNDTAMSSFKKKLSKKDCSIMKGEFAHVRCMAHILNLVVSDGLKEKNDSIERIREAVRYVRQSPARLAKFKDYAKIENVDCTKSLCLDVPTRWNSKYMMLDVAGQYDRVFDRFNEQEPTFKLDMQSTKLVNLLDENKRVVFGYDGKAVKVAETFDCRPTSEDWVTCKQFATLLKKFYEATIRISGRTYVTANLILPEIFEIYSMLKEWELSDDSDLVEMGSKMKQKFDKYWGSPEKMNPLIYISLVLDPRYKLEFVVYILETMFGEEIGRRAGDKLSSTFCRLYNEYKAQKEPQGEGNKQPDQGMIVDEARSEKEKRKLKLVAAFKKQKTNSGGFDGGRTSEIDKYLKEEIEPIDDSNIDDSNFDILGWWKQNSNSHRFPILSLMARDVLAIPMSTVSSESAFSTGGRLLDPFRSSLTPKLVETLICAQDWLRESGKEINVEEDLDELENLEEELSNLKVDSSSMATMMEF